MEGITTRPSTLEIMVISGENLTLGGRNPVKENAFVVVRAESLNCCTTKMASSSTSLLSWNENFLMDIPLHARSITFEVQCKTSKGAVKNVGVARIAISDFLGGGKFSGDAVQTLSYWLRDWDGRRSGVIHFSVRTASLPVAEDEKPALMLPSSCGGFEGEVMGFPVDEKKSNGVPIGIPVW